MARDLISSKFSLTGGIGGQSNRRSSIPKLVQAEDRENGAPLASLENGVDYHKKHQVMAKKYHEMVRRNQMLAKENARLRNKHSALEREQRNLLQVSNPVDQLVAAAYPKIQRDVEVMRQTLDQLISGLNQLSLQMSVVATNPGQERGSIATNSGSTGQERGSIATNPGSTGQERGSGELVNGSRLSLTSEQIVNHRRASFDRINNHFKENSNLSTIIEISHTSARMSGSLSSGRTTSGSVMATSGSVMATSGSVMATSGSVMASGTASSVTNASAETETRRSSSIIRVSISRDDQSVTTTTDFFNEGLVGSSVTTPGTGADATTSTDANTSSVARTSYVTSTSSVASTSSGARTSSVTSTSSVGSKSSVATNVSKEDIIPPKTVSSKRDPNRAVKKPSKSTGKNVPARRVMKTSSAASDASPPEGKGREWKGKEEREWKGKDVYDFSDDEDEVFTPVHKMVSFRSTPERLLPRSRSRSEKSTTSSILSSKDAAVESVRVCSDPGNSSKDAAVESVRVCSGPGNGQRDEDSQSVEESTDRFKMDEEMIDRNGSEEPFRRILRPRRAKVLMRDEEDEPIKKRKPKKVAKELF